MLSACDSNCRQRNITGGLLLSVRDSNCRQRSITCGLLLSACDSNWRQRSITGGLVLNACVSLRVVVVQVEHDRARLSGIEYVLVPTDAHRQEARPNRHPAPFEGSRTP